MDFEQLKAAQRMALDGCLRQPKDTSSALALKLRKPIRVYLHIPAPSTCCRLCARASVVISNVTSLKAVGVELEVHLAA